MDQDIAAFNKAYKAICKRIGARCITTGLLPYCVRAKTSSGKYFRPFQAPESFSTISLYAPRRLRSRKEIVSFLLETAMYGQLKCNGKIAVYENESLESLAIEADLGE